MQLIKAETFSVQFPYPYEHAFSLRGNIMAEHKQNDQCLSYINISLQELNTFDEYEGDDLPARFRAFCLDERGTVEVITDKTLKVVGKPDEWMVLLRVSSDNNPGFCFWDAGEIYFVIHKSDLDKKDFSNVYCGLESS